MQTQLSVHSRIAGSYCSGMFNFMRNCENCSSKLLYYFAFPPATCEREFTCSTFLSAFDIVRFGVFWLVFGLAILLGLLGYLMVCICSTLLTDNREHLFMCLLTLCVFVVTICLFRVWFFCHFPVWSLLLLLNYNNFLPVL